MMHHPPIKHPMCVVYQAGEWYEFGPRKDGWCYAEDGVDKDCVVSVDPITLGPCIKAKFRSGQTLDNSLVPKLKLVK